MRIVILLVGVTLQLACADVSARHRTTDVEVAQQAANPDAAAAYAFQQRVKQYVAWRNKVESTVAKLVETDDPAKIAARERALGEALIKARGAHAQPGEFFVKEYVPVLKKTIKDDFAKRTAAERKALVVELPKGVKLGINQIYPTAIPLATFPGNLLKVLPDLPQEVEYRIVSRHLILRDVEANYVVDIVPNVFPIPR
jgi:hypothetical protein